MTEALLILRQWEAIRHTVRQAAKKLDPNSFVIILDSNEVAGEGFRHL